MDNSATNEQPQSDNVKLALIGQDVKYLRDSVDKLTNTVTSQYVPRAEFEPIKNSYVSQAQFDPVRRIVYGLIAAMGIIVIASILYAIGLHGGHQ
jgi:hypothetical protein